MPPDMVAGSEFSGVHQRSRRGEQLARLQPRLQAGEDHRPAAVKLVVGAFAELVVGDGQAAGIADGLDVPGDPRGSLALHLVAPEGDHALDQPARRVDLEVLPLAEHYAGGRVAHLVARAWRPVRGDLGAEVVLAPDL